MKSKKCNTIKILKNAVKALIMPVAVYLIFTAVTVGRFGSWAVIVTVLRTTVVPMLIAMAMSMPMIMGMWDFSAGAVVYAAAILGANVAAVTKTGVLGSGRLCEIRSCGMDLRRADRMGQPRDLRAGRPRGTLVHRDAAHKRPENRKFLKKQRTDAVLSAVFIFFGQCAFIQDCSGRCTDRSSRRRWWRQWWCRSRRQ